MFVFGIFFFEKANLSAFTHLKKLVSMQKMSVQLSFSSSAEPRDPGPTSPPVQRQTSMWENLTGKGANVLAKGAKVLADIKNLLPANKMFPVTRIVSTLMENSSTASTSAADMSSYLYFDPKHRPSSSRGGSDRGGSSGDAVPNHMRKKSPFSSAIVFVVGGGNYVEFQNLQDFAAGMFASQLPSQIQVLSSSVGRTKTPRGIHGDKTTKRIIYGTTELMNPAHFISQLSRLEDQDSNHGDFK